MIKTASAGNFLVSGNFGCEAFWNLTRWRTQRGGSPDRGQEWTVGTDCLSCQTELCWNPASWSLSFITGNTKMITMRAELKTAIPGTEYKLQM
jgi:hypothetical protein